MQANNVTIYESNNMHLLLNFTSLLIFFLAIYNKWSVMNSNECQEEFWIMFHYKNWILLLIDVLTVNG